MRGLLSDLRFGFRRLRLAPTFTALAAVTLALSIGATTATYSVVDGLMFRPLPYPDPSRLVDLSVVTTDAITRRNVTSDQLLQWRGQSQVFAAVEGHAHRSETITGGAEPETALGTALTGGMMAMLHARPQLGRVITETDARPGFDQVVVISDAMWRTRFDRNREAIGQSIKLGEKTYQVIGVMPPAFNFPYGKRSFWVPLTIDPGQGSAERISLTARVRSDLDVRQAQIRLDTATPALVESKLIPPSARVELAPPIARPINTPVRRALYVLAGAVALVMLIACANIANLLLVQGAGRVREIAVRTALGASRRRLIRELFAETLILAAIGGAGGVLVAQWSIDLLAAYTPREMTFLNNQAIELNLRVLVFAMVLTILTAVLFGLLPALRGSGETPRKALQDGARSATSGPRQERLRRGFVLVQIALSLMLLVGAGLLARSFVHMIRLDPGFDPQNLIAVSLPPRRGGTPRAPRSASSSTTSWHVSRPSPASARRP
jgi:putative ABC transport system permease protein